MMTRRKATGPTELRRAWAQLHIPDNVLIRPTQRRRNVAAKPVEAASAHGELADRTVPAERDSGADRFICPTGAESDAVPRLGLTPAGIACTAGYDQGWSRLEPHPLQSGGVGLIERRLRLDSRK
jgi:hypothetical protein